MKTIFWAVIVLLIIFGLVAFVNRDGGSTSQVAEDDNAMTGQKDSIKNIAGVRTASLVAVDGSSSSGVGYIVRADGKLMHLVEAEMPEPADGNSYEGWLVDTSASPLKFFSTGIISKNASGTWILEYETDQEYPGYDRVVITEETIMDETPERHVIEGDFK